jgi:ATP-dependent DNA helicase PIF1
MGIIRDIVWAEGADYQREPPLALLVDFDDYDQDAPSLVTDPESGHMLVPIFFVKRDWNKGTVHCTRTQFHLTIAYAITIHKSQGLSVYRAVLNPGKKKDFALGLTYVAILRVRSLPGIMFKEPFDFKRLKSSTSDITIMQAIDAEKRL